MKSSTNTVVCVLCTCSWSKQACEQPLRIPGMRLCHPDHMTSTAGPSHPLSATAQRTCTAPTPRPAAPGHPPPRWEVPQASWHAAAHHTHTPAPGGHVPVLPRGRTSSPHGRVSLCQSQELFFLTLDVVLKPTLASTEPDRAVHVLQSFSLQFLIASRCWERRNPPAREKQRGSYKGAPIRLSAGFSKETLQARRGWQEVFKVMKSKDLQPRLLYPAKLSFRMEGQIKCFPDKVKLKEFITKPLLYEMLQKTM